MCVCVCVCVCVCLTAALFEAGLRSNEISAFYNGVTTYESNVLFALRVMIDKKVVSDSATQRNVPSCDEMSCRRAQQ